LKKWPQKKKANFRRCLKLQSSATVFLALLLYSALSSYLFSPRVVTISNTTLQCIDTGQDISTRNSLTSAIANARESITLIHYSLTDKHIIRALQDAANNGVKVNLIYDPTATPEPDFFLGPAIKKHARKERGLMHHKLLAIDHAHVWLGSTNLTAPSLLSHGNLTLGFNSPELANEIEELAKVLKNKQSFHATPLEMQHNGQRISFFVHPFHGKASLNALLERIKNAQQRIFVAMYTFTHQKIAEALCEAHERGVDVRVIFDKDSKKETSKHVYVRCKRNGIRTGHRTKPGLLHYKTALIDNSLVTGSCNWTKAGFQANDDSILIIDTLTPDQQLWFENWWQSVEDNATYS